MKIKLQLIILCIRLLLVVRDLEIGMEVLLVPPNSTLLAS